MGQADPASGRLLGSLSALTTARTRHGSHELAHCWAIIGRAGPKALNQLTGPIDDEVTTELARVLGRAPQFPAVTYEAGVEAQGAGVVDPQK